MSAASVASVAFVTGNAGKLATACEHLAAFDVDVDQTRLELAEIQSTSVAEVATRKARDAYELLGKPLFVEDSGLEIVEFGGWPGPMVKCVLDAVGPAGLVHLADLTSNRGCRFVSVLAYVDSDRDPTLFTDTGELGTIATAPAVAGDAAANPAWSELWSVFVPPSCGAPLAALAGAERERLFATWKESSVFASLGRWLTG